VLKIISKLKMGVILRIIKNKKGFKRLDSINKVIKQRKEYASELPASYKSYALFLSQKKSYPKE